LVEPHWEPPSVQPQWEEPMVQQQWEEPLVEPHWEPPSVQPQWEESMVQVQWEEPSVQSQWQGPLAQNQWEEPKVQPQLEKPMVQPQREEPIVQAQLEEPLVQQTIVRGNQHFQQDQSRRLENVANWQEPDRNRFLRGAHVLHASVARPGSTFSRQSLDLEPLAGENCTQKCMAREPTYAELHRLQEDEQRCRENAAQKLQRFFRRAGTSASIESVPQFFTCEPISGRAQWLQSARLEEDSRCEAQRRQNAEISRQRQKAALQKKLQELEDNRTNLAATQIQSFFRGSVGRKQYQFEKQRREAERHQQRVQQETLREAARRRSMQKAAKQAERDAIQQKLLQMERKSREAAAVKIQSLARGHRARYSVQQQRMAHRQSKERQKLELEALRQAVKKQSLERRQHTRLSSLQDERDAAKRRQREIIRKKLEDMERKKQETAAIKIQTRFRGSRARQSYRNLLEQRYRLASLHCEREAAKRRQPEIIKQKLDTYHKKQEAAAIKIQSFSRGSEARRSYRNTLEHRYKLASLQNRGKLKKNGSKKSSEGSLKTWIKRSRKLLQ